MACTTIFGNRRFLPRLQLMDDTMMLPSYALQYKSSPFHKQLAHHNATMERSNKPAFVQHDYHDYANEIDCTRSNTPQQAKAGPTSHFPDKLHEMLEQVESSGLEHIVSWQPHGRCFIVHDTTEFVNQVLPKYFKQSKIASFQRQLNLYGFQRMTKGSDKGGYYHQCFLRGRKDLCEKINRIKIKGTGVRSRANPDTEPNFWTMSWIARDGTVKPDLELSISDSSLTGLALPDSQQSLMPLSLTSSDKMIPSIAKILDILNEDNTEEHFEGKHFHAIDAKRSLIYSLCEPERVPSMNDVQLTEDLEPGDITADVVDDEPAFRDLLQRLMQEV